MTRTQIQLPDEIYARAKRVAEAREISLAELTRRGLELILEQYPAPETPLSAWRPPIVQGLGWTGRSAEEIKALAQQSPLEAELESEAQRRAGR